MTFQPVVPLAGYGGWRFLTRTIETQREAFGQSPQLEREKAYFRETIANAKTAEDLVSDRRLLTVALGAFGLDADIGARAFIREILEEGTIERDALANRLADPRYRQLSLTFGYGDLGARTGLSGFADQVLARYEARRFEQAVGEQDNSMRLALNLKSGLDDLLKDTTAGDARWFAMMGNKPLRTVFETALGFPSSFGSLDIDLQLDQFRDRARSVFGTDQLADFAEPEQQEKLIRLFLIRDQAQQVSSFGTGSIALALLQSAPRLF